VKTNVLITAAFILLPIMTTNAQIMSTLSAGDQAAYFNFGLDPAVLTTFGYARGFEAAFINRHVTASAELSLPVSKLDLNDYRLKIGARASVINYNSWDFSIPIHLILRGTQNWMHTATNFGADITALFGYYRDRWFVNLEFGYDSAFMTKITATDRYKKYYYHDFKDGWYGNTGHFFTRGLATGFRWRRTEIVLRAGQPIIHWSAESSELLPPFYGILGVNYLF